MKKKKKKETIGTISGAEMLKKTRGIQTVSFRTGEYQNKKDKPRDKNWKRWIG